MFPIGPSSGSWETVANIWVDRFALGAAAFALGKKLVTDKTLRLGRSKPKPAESH